MNKIYKLVKNFVIIFLALLLISSPMQIIAFADTEVIIDDPTPDTTPPTLDNLTISELTVGKSYKLSGEFNDDLSGIQSIYGYYQSPSGTYSKSVNFSYNSNTKKYDANISFSDYDESGTWKLSQLTLRDNKDNSKTIYDKSSGYSTDTTMDFTPFYINVIGGLEDTVAPVLNAVDITPKSQVTDGAVIKVEADITDEGSGVRNVYASFMKPSRANKTISLNYNQTTGKYEGSFKIDKYDELGEWKLYYISTEDNARNSKVFYDATLNSSAAEKKDFSSLKFEVKDTTPDLLGPILDTLAISLEKTSNNSAVIKLTADISDNLSGINNFNATYLKPSGKSYYVNFRNNYSSGKYEASIPIDKYDELGTWKLKSVSLTDNKGNYIAIMDNLQSYYKETMDFTPFYFIVRGIITIPPPTPFSITTSEKILTMKPGESYQLKALLNMSDANVPSKDITLGSSGTTYTSSDSSVVSISKDGLITIDSNASPSTAYIQVANSGKFAQVKVEVSGGTSEGYLEVNPIKMSLSSGQTKQLKVLAHLADGTTKDVTLGETGTQYSSSNPSILSVTNDGFLKISTGAQQGNVKVNINHNGLVSVIDVNLTGPPTVKAIQMTPSDAELNFGETVQLSVRATMTDGESKDITEGSNGTVYVSSDETKAIVDNNGLVKIKDDAKSGKVTIKAINNSLISQAVFTINGIPEVTEIKATPSSMILKQGENQTIDVMASYSDGAIKDVSSEATYKSGNPSVVVVDSKGKVSIPESSTGGTVNIVITLNGKTTTLPVTVPKIPVLDSLTFTPSKILLKPGEKQQLEVNANYSDGSVKDVTSEVAFESSDNSLAVVDHNGLITINDNAKGGTVYIRGTYGGKGGSTTLTIPLAPTVTGLSFTPSSQTVKPGEIISIKAIANYSDGNQQDITPDVSLKSTNSNLAVVDSSNGLIKIPETASNGTVYIQGEFEGKGSSVKITVSKPYVTGITFSPGETTIKKEESLKVKVTANYSDGSTEDVTNQTTFTSSNTAIATVDSDGEVKVPDSSKGGTVYIRGTYEGKGGVTTLKVLEPPTVTTLSFTVSNSTLNKGDKVQVIAIANYSDGTTEDVTSKVNYSSSNIDLATVDTSGLVTVSDNAKSGTVYIRGIYEGKGGAVTLTIPPQPSITSLTFNPSVITMNKGTSLAMKVIANYSNGTTEDVTSKVTFTSSNNQIASVDTTGLVTASSISTGTVYIRGSYAGKGATSTVKVQ